MFNAKDYTEQLDFLEEKNKEFNSALHCTRLQKCYCGHCAAVHHGPYGVLIPFPVSIKDSCEMMSFYHKKYGYDIYDKELAHEYNVALCITTKELSEKWKKQLRIDN